MVGVLALAVLIGTVVALLPAPSPVAAADGCPRPVDRNGNCPVGHTIPLPGPTRPGTRPGPGTTAPSGPGNPGTSPDDHYYCEWYPYADQEQWRSLLPEAPPGSVFGEVHCFLDGRPIYGPWVPQYRVPDTALRDLVQPPPTPAEVAADAQVSVEALLEKPTIATSPPSAQPSTLGLPTFVSVPNWQGVLTPPDHCLRGVCVSLRAEPALTFDPGQPGADTIACEDGGTVFDRNGADPEDQAAAAGACAYTYTRRTGVAGRPDAWTGEVTIRWIVTWRGGGVTGTLAPIDLSTTFDRAVEENRTVVTDYSD